METPTKATSLDNWSTEAIFEMVNDMVCFHFMLELMRRIKNIEVKGYVSSFLKLLAPIYIYELVCTLDKIGAISRKDTIATPVWEFIDRERQRAVKNIITKSSRAEDAVNEMGIDFSREIYDMNIVVSGTSLIDMNYEQYADPVDNRELWDQLFSMPQALLSAFSSALARAGFQFDFLNVLGSLDEHLTEIAQKMEQHLNCTRYTYPSCRLFSNAKGLTEGDRILILYRHRLTLSATIIPDIIPNFSMTMGDTKFVDTAKFFRKYKAIVIEILGLQFRQEPTTFTSEIMNDLSVLITDASFYSLNRAIRNNLHYETNHILSAEELSIVDRYQNVYLGTVAQHFNSCLTIDIDKGCRRATNYFKACLDKGWSKEEIDHHSYLRYLIFCLTGKLIK